MSLNYLDCFILLVLAWSFWTGLRLGFFRALGGMANILLGLLLAIIFSDDAAWYLEQHYGLITVTAEKISILLPEQLVSVNNILATLAWPNLISVTLPYKLAEILVLILCFIAIMLVAKLISGIFFGSLHHLVKGNMLGGLNSILGSVLALVKNTTILSLLLGLLTPVLVITSAMGWQSSEPLLKLFQSSFLAVYLYSWFDFLKNLF